MDDSRSDEFKNKNVHPKVKANVFSNLFFCWCLPVLYKGWRKEFEEDDLYRPLKQHESHRLGDRLEELWKLERMSSSEPALWRAIWTMFRKEIVIHGIVLFCQEFLLRIPQPLAIGKVVMYFSPDQTSVTKTEAYLYAGFIIATSFLYVVTNHSYMLACQHLGMKIRVACCSLIYRKSLKLSKTALVDTTIGQMINLLSNDVVRFDKCFNFFHFLWVAPLETLLIVYLLYANIGVSSLTGFLLLFIFIPTQMLMGKLTSIFRLRTAIKTDERVRLMSEIIGGIQVIKMYTWEKPFAYLVEKIRKLEVMEIKKASYIRALHSSFKKFIPRTSVFLCVLTFTLTGNKPTANYVYVVGSFYNMLKDAVATNFPVAISDLAETMVSVKRIETFLMFNEVKGFTTSNNDKKIISSTPLLGKANKKSVGAYLHNVSAKWIHYCSEDTLKNINFNVTSKQVVSIVGPVGSGKTSLLHIIMKELPLTKGYADIVGRISYASQEPWLFAGTVKQNIIFGEEWDKKKYCTVIKVCALERDLELLPYGDRTLVGDRGVALSGGQKARINLARAIYKDADIYLLDDPLSAVDTHVGKQLFDDCITGYLKNKCTVLVTHQLQYLKTVSKIYVMDSGNIAMSGSYEEIQNANLEFSNLFKEQIEEDDKGNDVLGEDEEEKKAKINRKDLDDEPMEVQESRQTGKISSKVYIRYLKAGGGVFWAVIVFLLFVVCQLASSGADYFINFWINLEQSREKQMTVNQTLVTSYYDDVLLEEQYDSLITGAMEYIERNKIEGFFTTGNCLYLYLAIILTVILSTVIRSISFYKFCIKASINLHNNMFSRIVYGPMRFFNTNPTGRILNRFSKDMGSVDEVLPFVGMDTLQIALNALAVNCVIASVDPWIMLPTLVIALLFYFYRIVFLSTSRNVKRMEATTRSPVFSHMNASLQGLTTIRAFGAQEILRKEFDNYQDHHSSAFYLFMSCNATFGFWLDFHCIIYVALVTLTICFFGNEQYGGNVGLGITQAMSLTGMFQWGMRQWSELENSMTSVERVVEYTDMEQESEGTTKKEPPRSWPEHGKIEFQSVYLRYDTNMPYVLNNLTFKIRPKEKVGIVGRTGAGKSTIISALFRLAETEGKILIDGIATNDIPIKNLRSKISIIPQEPVLFSGTLRSNLDPFNEHPDTNIWEALEQVELKEAVSRLTAGLDSKVSEGGSNFSVGQRQLICLARAIVKNNKILVLDEATANVDPKTDQLIQHTIRTKFEDCTVLTIAHRLHTIMDSDKVLVMDAGSAVEFDHPHILLQDEEGIFYGLVSETGRAMADHLVEVAEKSFIEKMATKRSSIFSLSSLKY